MPSYCRIFDHMFLCPHCEQRFESNFSFQWGRVPDQYDVGDEIRWQTRRNGGIVEPWKYVRRHRGECYNAGDPTIKNVYLVDNHLFDPIYEPCCPNCGGHFEAAVLRIRDNRIGEIMLCKTGDLQKIVGPFTERPEIIEIVKDGHLIHHTEWNDHSIDASELY